MGIQDENYEIRVPVDMIQLTERNGKTWPLAFDWVDDSTGETIHVEIEDVKPDIIPDAAQKSGTVGDRYECIIHGQVEYLYYSILQPRKWFKLKRVSEAEYRAYYRLPGEAIKNKTREK